MCMSKGDSGMRVCLREIATDSESAHMTTRNKYMYAARNSRRVLRCKGQMNKKQKEIVPESREEIRENSIQSPCSLDDDDVDEGR